jgi:hypothetical protein
MPATAARPPSRRLTAVLVMLTWAAPALLAVGQARGQAQPQPPSQARPQPQSQPLARPQPQPALQPQPTVAKRLLVLPIDNVGMPAPPTPGGDALDALEAGTLPLGLHLGMTPEAVNKSLAHPLASVAPEALTPVAYLGPDKIGGFAIGMAQAGDLKPAIVSCFGAGSEIDFQFDAEKLYTISFRFARDRVCPDATGAADDLYQRLLAIPFAAMPSAHYRVGDIDVVDAWDPTVRTVIRRPWRAE